MPIEAQTLNQYVGTDAQGNGVTIVAPDMETACSVYNTQESTDPTIMQCTKREESNVFSLLSTSHSIQRHGTRRVHPLRPVQSPRLPLLLLQVQNKSLLRKRVKAGSSASGR